MSLVAGALPCAESIRAIWPGLVGLDAERSKEGAGAGLSSPWGAPDTALRGREQARKQPTPRGQEVPLDRSEVTPKSEHSGDAAAPVSSACHSGAYLDQRPRDTSVRGLGSLDPPRGPEKLVLSPESP